MKPRNAMMTPAEQRIQENRVPVGNSYLTMREWNVISMYISGYSQKSIAADLRMRVRTVNGHVQKAKDRLGLTTIYQLVALVAVANHKQNSEDA